MNVDFLGQVFTPEDEVLNIISLRKNFGSVMEPSCGAGSFSNHLENVVAIEYDSNVCPSYALNMDFFDYPVSNKFDSVIGNPPYVKFNSIYETTKSKLDMSLFDERSNLYLFFIEKCIKHLMEHGELIFIVPRDFLKSTSSCELNKFIYDNGTITDVIDYGDKIIFKGFSPNCITFRFEKNNFSRETNYTDVNGNKTKRTFTYSDGQLFFLSDEYNVSFSDLFFVKVGAVSGADKIYTSEEYGNMDFVCSETCKTGKTRRMVYNEINDYILSHKEELFSRKIIKTNENNWWKWGRAFYVSDEDRIYVNTKTRNKKPFFTHPCKNYDGSVMAIFPKKEMDIEKVCSMLNEVNWEELGFVCDGRFLFTQKSLENTLLPKMFENLS